MQRKNKLVVAPHHLSISIEDPGHQIVVENVVQIRLTAVPVNGILTDDLLTERDVDRDRSVLHDHEVVLHLVKDHSHLGNIQNLLPDAHDLFRSIIDSNIAAIKEEAIIESPLTVEVLYGKKMIEISLLLGTTILYLLIRYFLKLFFYFVFLGQSTKIRATKVKQEISRKDLEAERQHAFLEKVPQNQQEIEIDRVVGQRRGKLILLSFIYFILSNIKKSQITSSRY